jgi:cyclophilin family peptidyl-prolyl cis-trans isomerase/HEAT repeat protein
MILLRSCALLFLALPAPLAAQDPQLRHDILVAEDARPKTRDGLATILSGLTSGDTVAQRLAVRALGRQERADLIADITPLLRTEAASVRAEAVNALGQAASHDGASGVRRLLEERLGLESDPVVRGAIYRTLGRLAVASQDERDRTERLLIQGSRGPAADAPAATLEGITHGLASLYRRTAARMPAGVVALERLVELIAPDQSPLVRRLAMAALVASGRTDSGGLLDALRDPEWQVRRLAAAAAGAQAELPGRERIVARALADSAPQVRLEALRAYGRRLMARDGCIPVARALEDSDAQVQLVAIDLLGNCGPDVANTLASIAREPVTAEDWHRPAHAVVALAKVAPAQAINQLRSPLSTLHSPFLRSYLAEAAGIAADTALLVRLARDPSPNVRTAALNGLRRVMGHDADSLYLAALESRDYQLVMTAAEALDSTPDAAKAIPALGKALARVVKEGRETSVDARRALGTTLAHLGAPADTALGSPLSTLRFPSWTELERYGRIRATFVIAGGARFTLRLFPFDAPTNVARFVRMAQDGWFDGLTFHRVVPSFVVQGGSPGANEYVGDGPFTRDELGLRSNLRGTVGLSTRGRDTGDGQVYLNLVDNIRLDHDYTVWGQVVGGQEIVDALLEGAIIETIVLEEVPPGGDG